MRRKQKRSWSKVVGHYIAEEMRSNAHKKHKRPWNQVVAIGFARARKAGVTVPTGEGREKRLAGGGRRQAHGTAKQFGHGAWTAAMPHYRTKK